MADIKKISQIKLQTESYAIDVHNDLKAKLDTDKGDNLKVTTKGYVDTAISTEAAVRQETDEALAAAIQAEANIRKAADEALEKKLNEEIQRSTAKDAEHDKAISDEIANRKAADADLQAQLNTEVNRSTTKDAEHDAAIKAEAEARKAADLALENEKLDKKPDGAVDLIDGQGKISLHYLHDAIIGQMKFGGVTGTTYWKTDSGHVSTYLYTSDLLRCAMRTSEVEHIDDGEWHIYLNRETPTIYENLIGVGDFIIPEGFYFIANCDIPQEDAVNFGIESNIEKGDCLVSVGAAADGYGQLLHSHRWCKVDNTDAVKSVNGHIGNISIEGGGCIQVDDTGNTIQVTIPNTERVEADNLLRLTSNVEITGDLYADTNVEVDGQVSANSVSAQYGTVSATDGREATSIVNVDFLEDYIDENSPQSDWAENDQESPAYIKNRTHYTANSIEIVHLESPSYGGPPASTGYVFRAGETYDVQYWFGNETYRRQFTVTPGAGEYGENYCLIGSFPQGELYTIDIYLYSPYDNGEYDELISFGNGSDEGMINIYTVDVKQLDAKYIPVDGDTIQVNAEGKLIGATKIDLSAVDQDVNIINGHSLDVSGNVNIHGDLYLDGDIAFGNIAATQVEADYIRVATAPTEDTDVVNLKYFRENAGSGNVDLSGDVMIGGSLEVGGDLRFNGDFEIASLDAQSIKVNGQRVLVEGDVSSGSLLPDCTDYPDGSILVVRNGKWVIETPTSTTPTPL